MLVLVRPAVAGDLHDILNLQEDFGHWMMYQKDPEVMERCLPRILVAEEDVSGAPAGYEPDMKVVGYYHYIVSGDPGFGEMLRCWRQFPDSVVWEAVEQYDSSELCICMQGASHRDVFSEFIKYLQSKYSGIWCYCSAKSHRPDAYTELGFMFDPKEEFTFFNCNKGDVSTYRLGRWTR